MERALFVDAPPDVTLDPPGDWSIVAAGNLHTCVIRLDLVTRIGIGCLDVGSLIDRAQRRFAGVSAAPSPENWRHSTSTARRAADAVQSRQLQPA